MTPISQLLLRHVETLRRAGSVALVNPAADELAPTLADLGVELHVITPDHRVVQHLQRLGVPARFDAFPDLQQPPPRLVILRQPREKDRLEMQADALRDWLHRADGPSEPCLWLVGDNRTGIKSAARRLAPMFATVRKRDAARHGALFEARGPNRGAFDLQAWWRHWTLDVDGLSIRIASLPGVFAHGGLDDGSRLLLSTFEHDLPGGRVLDLACGAGVIGLALKRKAPDIVVTASDVSALALKAAEESAHINGVEWNLVAADGLDGIDGPFDWIVSNPPFHDGVETDTTMTVRMIQDARDRLTTGGRLRLVANRHLPYRRALDAVFGTHSRLAFDSRYQVLEARKSQ